MSLEKNIITELFDYKKGYLVWLKDSKSRKVNGNRAGSIDKHSGYIRITIKSKRYYAHRLIWMYHNGGITKGLEIDHINRDRSDNRIENLRLVTRQENSFNTRLKKGCVKSSNRWRATITVSGQQTNLGRFNTEEQAHQVYLGAKAELHQIKTH